MTSIPFAVKKNIRECERNVYKRSKRKGEIKKEKKLIGRVFHLLVYFHLNGTEKEKKCFNVTHCINHSE